MSNKERINKLLEALNEGVFEKEEAIKLSLLTSIAGESIFFLGMPGVAKSLIARRLKFAFKDAKAFEYLMNRFSTPDEVFGPISVTQLQQDNYMRIIENYLPDAEIVFLDEIWKAGPAIQNTLLTVLNEKIFRNGKDEIKVKLKGLIAASNELPAENDGHNDSVEALWDRFILRLVIGGVKDEGNFNNMISDDLKPTIDNVSADLKITDEEYKKWDKAIDTIMIPEEVYKVISIIRKKIQEYNDGLGEEEKELYISDRRWRKIIRILRTSAFLNERKEVDLMDCFLIKDCIWNDESEIETGEEIVADSIRNYGYTLIVDIESVKRKLGELDTEVKTESTHVKEYSVKEKTVYQTNYYKFIGLNTYPQYCLIEKTDFSKITETQQSFYLNTENLANHRHTAIYKSGNIYKIADSSWSDCQIETQTIPKRKKESKRPSEKLLKLWDGEVNDLIKEIQEQIAIIEKHRKKKLNHLQTNIFVSKDLSTIVEENLFNSVHQLQDLKIEVEKIKSFYDGLE
ncbi:MAG: AAA family ATPase [Bacteroidales bacterium]|jgi:MoxR-like ATPase|nr:AAA family ATPase [Bacteroidales bacterium]